ncbi:MAG TPA: hypothetical protein VMC09_15085 [Anaerolineales bacterium]|nr:hypothetical protein [Anaerolineales bacterium]
MTAFVGGEFWFDPRFQTDSVNVRTDGMLFLNGGEAALRLLCDDLTSRGVGEILAPSYMCPTIADAFDRYGLAYTFYRIRPDFRIDLDDLLAKAAAHQVLYLINYFGYGFSAEELSVFEQLKSRGMEVIEDDAQGGFNRATVANIHFNSLRKMVPHDGCFFYSDRDLSGNLTKFAGLPNRRLPVIRRFRQEFARLLEDGAESFEELNPLFEQTEHYYYEDLTVMGDREERNAALRLDWRAIEAKRKANHRRLWEGLAGVPEIEAIFPKTSPHGPPLGFPIYVREGRRDALLAYLRERSVYPPVHWDILNDPRINKIRETAAMSAGILTLVLDQRFDLEDMEYEAGLVRAFWGHGESTGAK